MEILRFYPRLQAPASILPFGQKVLSIASCRTHVQDSYDKGEDRSAQRDFGGTEGSPEHPIPSNKSHPTLHDGKDSPIADFEGNLREDLSTDVKEHNEEVEKRKNRPYSHTIDEKSVKKSWK